MNNHTRPHKCRYCATFPGGAERKDLWRHLYNCHADEPAVRNDRRFRREHLPCPRCGKYMRADNLKRHLNICGHGGGR
jgi:hypothetical protein